MREGGRRGEGGKERGGEGGEGRGGKERDVVLPLHYCGGVVKVKLVPGQALAWLTVPQLGAHPMVT